MAAAYQLTRTLPELADPLLVTSFTGWIDASSAAETAFNTLSNECGAELLAVFDGDEFIDYRARRPTMELRDGVNTRLVWPDINVSTGRTADGRDIVLLGGPEPDTQWHRFCAAVTELAVTLGVVRSIGFGAYPFSTPHTRPTRMSCTSPSADTFAGLPFLTSSLDIPAGAAAALEHALHDSGIPSLGIWVQVPHYLAAMPYPTASTALLDMLCQVTGVRVGHGSLDAEAAVQLQRIGELISGNQEHADMVRQLEMAYDASVTGEVPSAHDMTTAADTLAAGLAAEVERFLRDQAD